MPWPDKRLSPNARHDRRAVAGVRKVQRSTAWALTKQAVQRFTTPQMFRHLNITFFPPDNRRRDLDNMLASIKSALDGVADALGVDDAEWSLTIQKGEVRKGGAVEIQLCLSVDALPVEGVIS